MAVPEGDGVFRLDVPSIEDWVSSLKMAEWSRWTLVTQRAGTGSSSQGEITAVPALPLPYEPWEQNHKQLKTGELDVKDQLAGLGLVLRVPDMRPTILYY